MENDFTLRNAEPYDANRLALLGAATFLETFAGILEGDEILQHCAHKNSVEQFAAWLHSPVSQVCIAEVRRAPVGYAALTPPELPLETDDRDIELRRIYLLHRFQKAGAGSALLTWSIEESKRLGKSRLLLGVYAGNDQAIGFYQRHGFAAIGTRQFRVGSQICDDLILALQL